MEVVDLPGGDSSAWLSQRGKTRVGLHPIGGLAAFRTADHERAVSAASKYTAPAAASFAVLVALVLSGAASGGSKHDRIPPSAPTNLRVTAATPDSLSLAWNASRDNVAVAGYYLYLYVNQHRTKVDGTSYTVHGLQCGQTFEAEIVAFDASNNRSLAATATVSTAACPDLQPPTAPVGFRQQATTQTGAVLAWDASSDNVGVVGYDVYRDFALVSNTARPAATLGGLSCGSAYRYQVDAYDAAGNHSTRSSIWVQTAACGDSQPPTAPTGLAVRGHTDSSISLSWSASTDNVGVAGYRVSLNGAAVTSVTGTSATLSPLPCGTTFSFSVDAYDAAGNRSSAAVTSAATDACPAPVPPPPPSPPTGDTTPPSQPTSLKLVSIAQDSVTLGWAPSTDDVGVTGYDVYVNGKNKGTVTMPGATVSGLTCGTTFTFAVDAYDAAGNRSTRVDVTGSTGACSKPGPTADTTPPTTPSNLAVARVTQTSVSLTWSASTDSVGVTGYDVYRDGTSVSTVALPGAIISGLSCGTAYTFAVDAYDAAGNRSTRAYLTTSTFSCADSQAPSAPTGVTASSRTGTSIALTWSASKDDVGVTGYGLYRAGVQISTVTGTTGIFTGLTCNTSYTLAVDAYDAAGNHSGKTTVMVSTTACPDSTPPSTPTGLAASNVTQTSLDLSWNTSRDDVAVAGYDVYRAGTKMATVTSTSSSQTGLACGASYAFGVVAFDAAGNRSQQAQLNVSTSACSPAPPPSPPPTGPHWFSDSSPWSSPIPSNPTIVSQSSTWINALYGAIGGINVNQGSWTPTVFTASQSDRVQTMVNQDGWIVDSVPIPSNLQPSPDSDAHAIVIAPWLNRAYEFFGLRKDSTGKWTFSAADVVGLGGSGWWDGTYSSGGISGPWGARASGGALAGGLIRVEDAQSRAIPHALACSAPKALIGPPVRPARTSDGSGGSAAMPMGSRLQLDPSLNVSSLGLEPGEEMIARALQTYGAYIVDSSSTMACYAQNFDPLGSNPYPASWSNGIRRDLVLKMRVVAPPSAPVYDDRTTFGEPHR
jgi:chitodextrinase